MLQDMAIKAALNRHALVQAIGYIQKLHLDTKALTLELLIELKGDSKPIKASLTYEKQMQNEQLNGILITSLETDSLWLEGFYTWYTAQHGVAQIPMNGAMRSAVQAVL